MKEESSPFVTNWKQIAMLHKVGRDLDISVTATSSFIPRRAEKVEEKRTTQLEQLTQNKQEAYGNETSTTEQKFAKDETRQLKLPVLPATRRVNDEQNNDPRVLLCGIESGIQRSDFSLQELSTEWIDKSTKKSQDSCSQRLEPALNTPEFTQERVLFVPDQNQKNNSGGELEPTGGILRERSQCILPITGSILEGQRVNLREKMRLNKQRKQVRCRIPRKANKLCNQSESTAETFDTDNILMKTPRTSPSTVSLKTGKQGTRPVFHLPKADKYDITPNNIIHTKVCSVFKVGHLKSSSGYKNRWIHSRDSSVIKNSVFYKAIAQPTVFLRQPSPVAGVKMTLKEHEDSLAAAIQAVEETNVSSQTVDAEISRHVKKFVIRLPPIA